MNNYNKHWTSKKESTNQISKLNESQIYNIVDVQKIQTAFGKKYILIDDDNNRYWTTKNIDEFIKENKQIKHFELSTSEFKIFTNKKGEAIKYLEIDINY